MKRDLDLVRRTLLAVEALDEQYATAASELSIDGYDASAVVYHVGILANGGYITVSDGTSLENGTDYLIGGLTWSGHEFVDAARDDSRWSKLMQKGRQVVEAAGLGAIKSWLQDAATAGLNALGGGMP